MKLRDLQNILYDDVVIYKRVGCDYEDLYKGEIAKAKDNLLNLEVISVGAKRKGTLDIQVIE